MVTDFPTLSSGAKPGWCQNWHLRRLITRVEYGDRVMPISRQGLHEGFHLNGQKVGFYEDDRPIGSHF